MRASARRVRRASVRDQAEISKISLAVQRALSLTRLAGAEHVVADEILDLVGQRRDGCCAGREGEWVSVSRVCW